MLTSPRRKYLWVHAGAWVVVYVFETSGTWITVTVTALPQPIPWRWPTPAPATEPYPPPTPPRVLQYLPVPSGGEKGVWLMSDQKNRRIPRSRSSFGRQRSVLAMQFSSQSLSMQLILLGLFVPCPIFLLESGAALFDELRGVGVESRPPISALSDRLQVHADAVDCGHSRVQHAGGQQRHHHLPRLHPRGCVPTHRSRMPSLTPDSSHEEKDPGFNLDLLLYIYTF